MTSSADPTPRRSADAPLPRARAHTRALYAAAFGLVAVFGLIAQLQTREILGAIDASAWVQHTQEVRLEAERLNSRLREMRGATLRYLLSGRDAVRRDSVEAEQAVGRAAAELRRLTVDVTQQRRLDEIEPALRAVVDEIAAARETAADERVRVATALLGETDASARYEAVRGRLREFADVEVQLLGQRSAAFERERQRAAWLLLGYQALALAALLLVALQAVRLQGRARLSAAERRAAELFRAGPLPMYVYDAQTFEMLDVNARALERYGFDREEFLRLNLRDLRPAEDVPRLEHLLARAGDFPGGTEWRHRTRSGEVIDVWIFTRPIEYDGRRARLALAEDITARKAAERERDELRDRLERTLATMTESFMLLDRDGTILFANPQLARLSRLQDERLAGRNVWEAFTDLAHGPVQAAFDDALASGRAVTVVYQRLGRDIETRIFPAGDAVAALTRDITRRRSAEREREHALQALAEREDRLARLSHRLLDAQEQERRAIARELHDHLGQELIAVRLALEAARTAPAAEAADRIEDAEVVLAQTIEQVRERALQLHPAVLDDLGLGAATQWLAGRLARADGPRVVVRGALPARTGTMIEANCFRVIQEALANALKHAAARHIEVRFVQSGARLQIEVRDDGRGFVPDAAAGQSLGLISMRERAELIGASLRISSAPGAGTTLTLDVPLPGPALPVSPPPSSAPAHESA